MLIMTELMRMVIRFTLEMNEKPTIYYKLFLKISVKLVWFKFYRYLGWKRRKVTYIEGYFMRYKDTLKERVVELEKRKNYDPFYQEKMKVFLCEYRDYLLMKDFLKKFGNI